MNFELLHYIYHFPGVDLPTSQDAATCKKIMDLFISFTEHMLEEGNLQTEPQSGYTSECFKSAHKALENIFDRSKKIPRVEWFPDYGCAVIFHTTQGQWPNNHSIDVIGLDEHKRKIHTGQKKYQSTSVAKSFAVLHVGECKNDELDDFWIQFKENFSERTQRKGDQRSAAGGRQGHQRTPAFVHAVLLDVLCGEKNTPPQGGFTDVGLHTGGEKRDTCFTLVRSVYKWLIDQFPPPRNSRNFEVVLLHFEIFLAKSILSQIKGMNTSGSKLSQDITHYFTMLKTTAIRAARLSDLGFDLKSTYPEIEDMKMNVDNAFRNYDAFHSEKNSLKKELFEPKSPKFTIPAPVPPRKAADTSKDEIMNLLKSNLRQIVLPNKITGAENISKRIENMATWAKKERGKVQTSLDFMFIFMHEIEHFFWILSENYLQEPLPLEDLDAIMSLIDFYRESIQAYAKRVEPKADYEKNMEIKSGHVLLNSIRCVELLLVWLGYCLVYKSVSFHYTEEIRGFGVALRFDDLKYLVLHDSSQLKILERVAIFLKQNYIEEMGLFSMQKEQNWDSPTLCFGQRYANKHLLSIHENEIENANHRIEKHWQEVVRKQNLAKTLRRELSNLEIELSNEITTRDDLASGLTRRERNQDPAYREVCRDVNRAQNRVNNKKEEIKAAEKAPPPVLQPLPEDRSKALKVLFFLYMPTEMEILSRLTFTAQQLLIPRPFQACVFDSIKEKKKNMPWRSHFAGHQNCQYYHTSPPRLGTEPFVHLSMTYAPPDSHLIGPRHVDYFHDMKDGIWYPDECNAHLIWSGGRHGWDKYDSKPFNPFMIASGAKVKYFTEKLQSKQLQWSVEMGNEKENFSSDHGNLPYASLDLKPKWLTKEAYLDFTTMRRFPTLPLRKFCVALQHGSLPYEHGCVQKLLRQTLFQIGDLSFDNNGDLQLEWRKDFEMISETCLSILRNLSSIFSVKPNFYKATILIAELCSYFSSAHLVLASYRESFEEISRNLAYAALEWAEKCDDEVKRVIFYQTAIMCIARENNLNTRDDICTLLRCILQAKNVFIPINRKKDNPEIFEMQLLNELCMNKLSKCLGHYKERILSDHEILSETVETVLASPPRFSHWETEMHSHVSFSAFGNDGHIYSINIFDGTILVNGLPPSQLPTNITEDENYMKIFGKHNFEVILKDDVYETVQPTFGYHYRFYKVNTTLVLIESEYIAEGKKEDYWNESIEFVDNAGLESNLPLKLTKAYSHWISRKHQTVIFRSFDFRDRQIFYIMNTNGCKSIPIHIKFDNAHWLDIIQHTDVKEKVHVHESSFLNVLARIEKKQLMLTSSIVKKQYSIHLYRFGLTFEFDETCSKFECKELSGFFLKSDQHYTCLHGFHQYLILQSNQKREKIIIPFGELVIDSNGVKVEYRNKSDDETENSQDLIFFVYDFHPRFQNLTSSSLLSRIFLAGLYLATDMMIPVDGLKMTGEEHAIEILRQCWINRPFTKEESLTLKNISTLAKDKSPTMFLLCLDLMQCATKCNFLNDGAEEIKPSQSYCSSEASAYLDKMNSSVSSRLHLDPGELQRCLGVSSNFDFAPSTKHATGNLIEVHSCDIKRCNVEEIENMISDLWSHNEVQSSHEEFPLVIAEDSNLEKEVMSELKKSWNLHIICESSKIAICGSSPLSKRLQHIHSTIVELLDKVEKYLSRELNDNFGSNDHWHMQALRFLKIGNVIPYVNHRDLATLACFRQKLSLFNPMLSTKACKTIHEAIITWLELCVLDDKLAFLSLLDKNGLHDNQTFINELSSQREWSALEHPYWLVFEVEQGIRIRPEQYHIANHLIENTGHSVQLNMGLGKTRVILPMLILSYSFRTKKLIPRLTVLSTLFQESCDYFQKVLTASVLCRKLFVLPFQRDVDIDKEKISKMHGTIAICERERGFLVTSPEHRLSLHLKVKELHRNKDVTLSGAVKGLFHDFQYFDVIDEIDEVLHHRYQLIYSIGEPVSLPQGHNRWKTVQGILKMTQRLDCPGVSILLDKSQPDMIPCVKIGENVDPKRFRECIANCLFDNPPVELEWLNDHKKRDLIARVITSPSAHTNELSALSEDHYFEVLSLRGLLAFDILLDCLKKRHRVDYGINKNGRKRLAVPFRGADTPSKRAEFSQADCTIVLTSLAYYDRGLRKNELEEALQTLLYRFGRNAKISIYDEWLQLNKAKPYDSISHVDKIDLTNCSQLELLFQMYSKNLAAINFWLNFCVFPHEIDHYTSRMVSNSWHLAHSDTCNVVGFSGTNDNHRIIPLQICQHLPWDTENKVWQMLLATNGRMLGVLKERTLSCEELLLEEGTSSENILNFLSTSWHQGRRIDALIDCGALLAGIPNIRVAEYVRKNCFKNNSVLKGVTFFDEIRGCWMIMDKSGRCLPKDQAPLREFETFAIFDEPRCRGVDLKLDSKAVATITLARNICKDKFMQAAGRMRQLHTTQSLIVVGEPKIFQEIRARSEYNTHSKGRLVKKSRLSFPMTTFKNSSQVSITQVLSWIIYNTMQSISKGLGMWSEQGLFFASENEPQHAVLDEVAELSALYGSDVRETSILNRVKASKKFHDKRTGGAKTQSMKILVERILGRSQSLGEGFTVMNSGVDEECERELEREVEKEEEAEWMEARMTPRQETDWTYEGIFTKDSPTEVDAEVLKLADATHRWAPGLNVEKVNWSNQVFCTENFFKTIIAQQLDNFLRIPDCFVSFPSGEKLLLSDREAHFVLASFPNWQANYCQRKKEYHFGHCVFESDNREVIFLRKSSHRQCNSKILSFKDASSVKLFNGECTYQGDYRQALKGMLSIDDSKIVPDTQILRMCEPIRLIEARAKTHDFDRSDLQKVCNEIATEYEMNED